MALGVIRDEIASPDAAMTSPVDVPPHPPHPTAHSVTEPAGQLTDAKETATIPHTVKYIIGQEFCERFSFYGMRAILALYLNERLHLTQNQATEMVHLFIVAAYLAPLAGAFICDSFLGKYKTILYLSFVYCTGNFFLSFSATSSSDSIAFYACAAGLLLLACGSGGIKPCVSAFGGDQIELTNPPGPSRDVIIRKFFSYFYFAINVGASFSTIVTPVMRAKLSYASAFALPAVLMIVATGIFWMGRKSYAHQEPSGNVVTEVLGIAGTALFTDKRKQQLKARRDSSYSSLPGSMGNLLETTRLLPADQQEGGGAGSSAAAPTPPPSLPRKLSKRGSKRAILPPGFVKKAHWLDPAKEVHGEEAVEDVKQLLKVLWLFVPVPIFWSLFDQQASRWVFQAKNMDGRLPWGIVVEPDQMQTINSVLILVMIPLFDSLIYPAIERAGLSLRPIRRMVIGLFFGSLAFAVSGFLQAWMDSLGSFPDDHSHSHAHGGAHALAASLAGGRSILGLSVPINGTFPAGSLPGGAAFLPLGTNDLSLLGSTAVGMSSSSLSSMSSAWSFSSSFHSHPVGKMPSASISRCYEPDAPPCVSLGWQVPQYVLMTAGEILFSITGLELAYSQAPVTMSSVVSACWLLTVAFGNLFTVLVVGSIGSYLTHAQEFGFFTAMCLLSMLLLMWVGKSFTYVESCVDLAAQDTPAPAPGSASVPVAVPRGGNSLFDIEAGGSVSPLDEQSNLPSI